mgnify:FL=1
MKKDKQPQLIEVGYDDNLSLAEARTRLEAIAKIVEDMRIKYAKSASDETLSAEQIKIDPADNALLNQCFEVILPLISQPSVQEEFHNAGTDERAGTLFAKATDLSSEVLTYASGVFDSGVTLLGPSVPQEGRPDLRLTGQTGK